MRGLRKKSLAKVENKGTNTSERTLASLDSEKGRAPHFA